MDSQYVFERIKEENTKLKRNQGMMTTELDKLKRTVADLTQQHRIDDERLQLARNVAPNVLWRGMTRRPSAALLLGQALINQNEVQNWSEADYEDLPSRVHESQQDAGQPISVAAEPVTNNDDVEDNSKEVGPTAVSILPHQPPHPIRFN